MQDVLLVTACVCLGLGFLSAIMSAGDQRKTKHHFWSVVGSVGYLLGAGTLVWWLTLSPRYSSHLIVPAIAFIAVGALLWIFSFTSNFRVGRETHPLKEHFRLAWLVALPGWKSTDKDALRVGARREASTINRVVNVGAALVIVPGLAGIMAASIVMNVRGDQGIDLLSNTVGFYTLLIAACWTLSYVLTILMISVVQVVRGNGNGLTLSAVAISLGTWAGLGAAAAVFVGALIPLVVVPLSKGEFQLLGLSLLDSISPTLLLDISTAGAVYGFLIGEVVSVISISGNEQNLYLKCVVPPFLFASTITVLGWFGLTPGKLSKALLAEYEANVLGSSPGGSDPFLVAQSQGIDSREGWANVVSGLDFHGWNAIVDQQVFFTMTWVIATLVALFSLAIHIRKREFELLQIDPSSAKPWGGAV